MNLGIVNLPVTEFFVVVDSLNNLIDGLDSTSITSFIYNPFGAECSATNPVTITGYGNGHYIANFTPNIVGTWILTLIHPFYFPYGKTGDIQVYTSDFTRIDGALKKVLGLVHQNIYIDQPAYDGDGNLVGGRLRIYSDSASVGTNLNVLATYIITSGGDGAGKFTYWQQVEI
jgi:hypothetical protein